MTKDILVLTHSADLDGICSQAIARKALGDAADYYPFDYGQSYPDLTPYRQVYVIDIRLSTEDMIKWREKLVWLDHHVSAIKELADVDIPGLRIDGVAACRLAWAYFFADRTALKEAYVNRTVVEPYAVQLLGRYDVWDKAGDENVDTFQLGMQAEANPDWDLLFRTMSEDKPTVTRHGIDETITWSNGSGYTYLDEIIRRGRAIHSYTTVTNAQIATERGFDVQFEGLTFRALNTARSSSLTFTAALKPHHDGCLSYFWNGRAWRFSLYHAPGKEHHDLSAIAKRYGGGGHRGACGFETTTLPPNLGGFAIHAGPPLPPNAESLPATLLNGRRVRVKAGHAWTGWTGTVYSHIISGDHCGSRWGRQEIAVVRPDGVGFSISPDDCEVLD